jgi:hypothetical protein
MTLGRFLTAIFCAAAIVEFLACLGLTGPGQAAWELLVGWIPFLSRTWPIVTVDWAGVAAAAFCLTVGGAGLHFFARWFYAQRAKARSPEARTGQPWRLRWTAAIIAVLVLMFVAGITVVGLSHQAAWLLTSPEPLSRQGRFAGERAQIENQLKQMGLGAHFYHDTHKHFPAGGVFDEYGRGLHGWQTFLLPYLEQEPLYRQINLKLPWTHTENASCFQAQVPVYLTKSTDEIVSRDGFALSHFAGNVRVLGGVPLKAEDIKDGLSNTLLAGEAAGNFKPWGHPRNWRDPALGLNRSLDGFGSPAPRDRVVLLFTDGSVRILGKDLSPAILHALSTPNGGETLPDGWDD